MAFKNCNFSVQLNFLPRSPQGTKDIFFSLSLCVLVAIYPVNTAFLLPADFFISHEVSKALRILFSLCVLVAIYSHLTGAYSVGTKSKPIHAGAIRL